MYQVWSGNVRPEKLPKMQNDWQVWVRSISESEVSHDWWVTARMLNSLKKPKCQNHEQPESFSLHAPPNPPDKVDGKVAMNHEASDFLRAAR